MIRKYTQQFTKHPLTLAVIFLSVFTGVILIGLQDKERGWFLWGIGMLLLVFLPKRAQRYLVLAYIGLGILGLLTISTDLTNANMAALGSGLILAVLIPVGIARRLPHIEPIRFPWRMGRKWSKREWLYIFLTAVFAYLMFPLYFRETGAYLNWSVTDSTEGIVRLFLGTFAVGLWDELFFINILLKIYQRSVTFHAANILQTAVFTGFLYELGFTGWGYLFIIPFAWVQGYIFTKTESLAYVVTIHLTLDFILFLALLNAHHPGLVPIFLT